MTGASLPEILTLDVLKRYGFQTNGSLSQLVTASCVGRHTPHVGETQNCTLYVRHFETDGSARWQWSVFDERNRGWGSAESYRFPRPFTNTQELESLISIFR